MMKLFKFKYNHIPFSNISFDSSSYDKQQQSDEEEEQTTVTSANEQEVDDEVVAHHNHQQDTQQQIKQQQSITHFIASSFISRCKKNQRDENGNIDIEENSDSNDDVNETSSNTTIFQCHWIQQVVVLILIYTVVIVKIYYKPSSSSTSLSKPNLDISSSSANNEHCKNNNRSYHWNIDDWDPFPDYLYEEENQQLYENEETYQKITMMINSKAESDLLLSSSSNEELVNKNMMNNYDCNPKYIHMSQRNNAVKQDDDTYYVSMTISFALPYLRCPANKFNPVVWYGLLPSSSSTNHNDNDDITVDCKYALQPVQFNYTSYYTGYDANDDYYYHSDNKTTYHSFWIYHAEISNIITGHHTYWYQIMVMNNNNSTSSMSENKQDTKTIVSQSKRYAFMTPPSPSSSTTIAIIGDLGGTDISIGMMANLYRRRMNNMITQNNNKDNFMVPISNLIIAGDISYATSHPNRWTRWFNLMEPLLSMIPLSTVVGNHEIECNTENLEVFIPYEHYFHVTNKQQTNKRSRSLSSSSSTTIFPKTSKKILRSLNYTECESPDRLQIEYDYYNSYYSYIHGNTKVIVLNSYAYSYENSKQYNWLITELQDINRSITPWLMIVFHVPFYTTYADHYGEMNETKIMLEPLFNQYHVNIVVSGHSHGYQRTYSMKHNNMQQQDNNSSSNDHHHSTIDHDGKSPIYFIIGSGGHKDGLSDYIHQNQQETFVANRNNEYHGYGVFHMVNNTHSYFEFINDSKRYNNGQEIFHDEIWIINHH